MFVLGVQQDLFFCNEAIKEENPAYASVGENMNKYLNFAISNVANDITESLRRIDGERLCARMYDANQVHFDAQDIDECKDVLHEIDEAQDEVATLRSRLKELDQLLEDAEYVVEERIEDLADSESDNDDGEDE